HRGIEPHGNRDQPEADRPRPDRTGRSLFHDAPRFVACASSVTQAGSPLPGNPLWWRLSSLLRSRLESLHHNQIGRITSRAGLSVRKPLNAGCWSRPPTGQRRYSISATSSGFTYHDPLRGSGSANGLRSVAYFVNALTSSR